MPEQPIQPIVIETKEPVRPFLKWLGGKTRVTPFLEPFLQGNNKFIEPFAGSGTVSLNLFKHSARFTHYTLADINNDLIQLYTHLRDIPDFIDTCQLLFTATNNTKDRYYELRQEFNDTKDLLHKSCLFIYLNRHCFNGVCRYNSTGGFNVPYGHPKASHFPEEALKTFKELLTHTTLKTGTFKDTMLEAGDGDVVYCDPPYVPLTLSASFTSYAKDGFSLEQQKELVLCAKQATERGATVIISNHDTELTREIYKDAKIEPLLVRRSVGSKSNSRIMTKELVACYRPQNSTIS